MKQNSRGHQAKFGSVCPSVCSITCKNKFSYDAAHMQVSVSCFGVRVSVMFHFMFVHYTFSSVWVVEWPPFGK